MLRALLAERLNLRTHEETRELQVYVLSRSKSDLKLRESAPGVVSKFTPPPPPPGQTWRWGVWRFEGFDMDVKEFLWPFLPTVVEDETGLQGRYEFSLNMGRYMGYYDPPEPGGRADLGPVLNRAMQEIGLQLEMRASNQSLVCRSRRKNTG
jgi:uncharacterized protein (TIGR03435 family)